MSGKSKGGHMQSWKKIGDSVTRARLEGIGEECNDVARRELVIGVRMLSRC